MTVQYRNICEHEKMVEKDAQFVTSGSKVLHVDRKHRHYFLRRKSNSDSRIVLVSY